MARWEPNARGRLVDAAVELFGTRGYDRTTVDQIAERAGLTERTFFRYFTDKREVLFSGARDMEQLMVHAITAAPKGSTPLAAIAASLAVVADVLEPRRKQAIA